MKERRADRQLQAGHAREWGFTDAWFDEHAPKLVRCSITGYGSTGPKAAQPGYDFILQAESGLMSITGAGGARRPSTASPRRRVHGMLASNAILAALNARHRTGRGQKIEVSLFESSLAMLVNVASNLIAGKDGGRFGNGHPSIVPYTTFQATDGMLALAVGNDAQFAKCAAALGHSDWARRCASSGTAIASRTANSSKADCGGAEDDRRRVDREAAGGRRAVRQIIRSARRSTTRRPPRAP